MCPCQSYDIEATVITVIPTTENSTKQSAASKPFRPSKQLFDQIVYGHPSAFVPTRTEVARAFDHSVQKEVQNSDSKSPETVLGNVLILPPETMTFKFDENYEWNNDNKVIKQNQKIKEANDIISINPQYEVYEDNIYGDTQDRPNEQKMKEVHYHKHRHFHEYDENQIYSRLNDQNRKYKNGNKYRNNKLRPAFHQNQQHDNHPQKLDSYKKKESNRHQHSSKSKHQHNGDYLRDVDHSWLGAHPQHEIQDHHNNHSSGHTDDITDNYEVFPYENDHRYTDDQYVPDNNRSGENKKVNRHRSKERGHKYSTNSEQYHRRRKF